jgi:GAF domain-containing protein
MTDILDQYPFNCLLSLKPFIDYLAESVADENRRVPGLAPGLIDRLQAADELLEPITDWQVLERHRPLVEELMGLLFPPADWDKRAMAAIVPFSMRPFHVTPPFQRLFLETGGLVPLKGDLDQATFDRGRAIRAYLFVLEKFYGIQREMEPLVTKAVPDPATGLDRYYQFQFDFRFCRAEAVGEAKVLTDEQRATILRHIADPDVIREILPPQDFEFQGFVVVNAVDVTEPEVMATLNQELINQESITSTAGFLRLQQSVRTLFKRPDVTIGLCALAEDHLMVLNYGDSDPPEGCGAACVLSDSTHIPLSEFEGSPLERVMESDAIIRIDDLAEVSLDPRFDQEFQAHGVRSFLLAPLHYGGQCVGTLGVKSPRPDDLGPMDELVLQHLQPLFAMAVKNVQEDVNSQIQSIIKEECTAVHPSVEWRFRQAAFKHLIQLRLGRPSDMEAIVFKDVHPFFGSSDIRGSTEERNRAIQADLIEHLGLGRQVVDEAARVKPMPILAELSGRLKNHEVRLAGGLGSGDEESITTFMRREIESIFDEVGHLGPKVHRALEAYERSVDQHLGTVYKRRRQFEQSVSILTERLAAYLDQEAARIQENFPHYFERHRTDGVDYLAYLGASMTEEGRFNPVYSKNMRLWQIMVACGLAWHTERLKSELPIELDTAHLILVQDAPLNVRFRYDEKKFDVDGAYDVRHQILRSRIDKAEVKGGGRLTQPGRVAVIHSHRSEALEMTRHLEFLRDEGFLTGRIERLELEDLPGVQGLQALRMEINLESAALTERLEAMAV